MQSGEIGIFDGITDAAAGIFVWNHGKRRYLFNRWFRMFDSLGLTASARAESRSRRTGYHQSWL